MRSALQGLVRLFSVFVPPAMRRQREPWVEPGNRITRAIWASLPQAVALPAPDVEYHMGVRQSRIMRPAPEAEAPKEKPGSDATDAAA